jgi:WD40 repeat protein
LAVGQGGGLIRFWDTKTGKEIIPFPGHLASVQCIAMSADGKKCVTGSLDRTVRIWEIMAGKQRQCFEFAEPIKSLALGNEGNRLAVTAGRMLFLISIANGRIKWKKAHHSTVCCVGFNPNGKELALGDCNGSILLLNALNGTKNRQLFHKSGAVLTMSFSPDGSLLAAGSENGLITIWNLRKRVPSASCHDLKASVLALAFSPCGNYLACGGKNKKLLLCSMGDNKGIEQVGQCEEELRAICFAPDGRTLACSGEKGTMIIWELCIKRKRLSLRGHDEIVNAIAFSPNGKALVSGSEDTTVLVWGGMQYLVQTENSLGVHNITIDGLWNDLGSEDGEKAFRAVCALVQKGTMFVGFAEKKLSPIVLPNSARIAKLIAEMENRRYTVRRGAVRELESLGKLGEPILRIIRKKELSLEVRSQIDKLLGRIKNGRYFLEEIRQKRAIEVLEYIGDSRSRAILLRLSKGHSKSEITKEANNALQRVRVLGK